MSDLYQIPQIDALEWLVFSSPGRSVEDVEAYKRACLARFVERFDCAPERVEIRNNGVWVGPIVEKAPDDEPDQLTFFGGAG